MQQCVQAFLHAASLEHFVEIVRAGEPGQAKDVALTEQFGQQRRVAACCGIFMSRAHQCDASANAHKRRQSLECEPHMVDHSKLVASGDDNVSSERPDEFARREMVAHRTEQTAGAFNEHHIKVVSHRADMRYNLE